MRFVFAAVLVLVSCGPPPLEQLGAVMVAPSLSGDGDVNVHFLDGVAGCRVPAGVRMLVNGNALREPYPGGGSWPSCAPARWKLPPGFVADRFELELTDGEARWVADYGAPQVAPRGTLTSAHEGILRTNGPVTLVLDPMPVVPALGAIQLEVIDGTRSVLFRRFLYRRGDAFTGEPGEGSPGHAGLGRVEVSYTREVEAERCEGFSTCVQVRPSLQVTMGIVRVEP